jgi:hypothetical protein
MPSTDVVGAVVVVNNTDAINQVFQAQLTNYKSELYDALQKAATAATDLDLSGYKLTTLAGNLNTLAQNFASGIASKYSTTSSEMALATYGPVQELMNLYSTSKQVSTLPGGGFGYLRDLHYTTFNSLSPLLANPGMIGKTVGPADSSLPDFQKYYSVNAQNYLDLLDAVQAYKNSYPANTINQQNLASLKNEIQGWITQSQQYTQYIDNIPTYDQLEASVAATVHPLTSVTPPATVVPIQTPAGIVSPVQTTTVSTPAPSNNMLLYAGAAVLLLLLLKR